MSRERCQTVALLSGSAALMLHRRGSIDAAVLLVFLSVATLIAARRATPGVVSTRAWSTTVVVSAVIGLLLPTAMSLRATVALTIGAVLIAAGSAAGASGRRVAAPALAATVIVVIATCAVVVATGRPVDVFAVLTGAASDVAHGINPYIREYVTYAPQSSPTRLDALPLHFPYGPLPALLAVPGWLIGDVRWSAVAACVGFVVLAAMIARRAGGALHSRAIAALCISLPLFGPMILNSWVDVEMVVAIALWLWLRPKHPRWSVLALAAALCVKPTALILLLSLALWSRAVRRQLLPAAVIAAALCLPFVLGVGILAFWDDLIGFQLALAPRVDALTLNAALWWHGVPFLPAWASLIAVGLTAAELLRRPPRDLNDALSAGAALTMASLVLAKFAYFNYYFPALTLLVIALAFNRQPVDVGEVTRSPLHRRGIYTKIPRPIARDA